MSLASRCLIDLPTHCDDVVGEEGTSSAEVHAVRKDFREEQTSVDPSSQFQVASGMTLSSLLPSHCVFRDNVSWNFYVSLFDPSFKTSPFGILF